MSMNLWCNKFDLLQTPTWVTYMCTVDHSGTYPYDLRGRAATAALQRYKCWLRGTLDGVWKNKKDLDSQAAFVSEHIRELDSVLYDEDIEVSIM